MTLLTSLSIRVLPKMNFVRMPLVRVFTCRDTVDDASCRTSLTLMPLSKETDGLAMEMNFLPLQAWTMSIQGSADSVPMASAPTIVLPLRAAMMSFTTAVLL